MGAGVVSLCEIRDSDEFFFKSKSNWEVVKKYFSNKRKSIRQHPKIRLLYITNLGQIRESDPTI